MMRDRESGGGGFALGVERVKLTPASLPHLHAIRDWGGGWRRLRGPMLLVVVGQLLSGMRMKGMLLRWLIPPHVDVFEIFGVG